MDRLEAQKGILLKVGDEYVKKISIYCAEKNISRKDLLTKALTEYLDRNEAVL